MEYELMQQLENFEEVGVCEKACIKAEHVVAKWWTNSLELISKKLIRNWNLGTVVLSDQNKEIRYYGNMTLSKDKNTNTIYEVTNNVYIRDKNYDDNYKKYLNSYLGIDSMMIEEGLKGDLYRHLPITKKTAFHTYVKSKMLNNMNVFNFRKEMYDKIKKGNVVGFDNNGIYIECDDVEIKYNNQRNLIVDIKFITKEEIA